MALGFHHGTTYYQALSGFHQGREVRGPSTLMFSDRPDVVYTFQLLFHDRWFQREDLFDCHRARRIDTLCETRRWEPHECYNVCHIESAQRVPADHRLAGRTHQSVGFVGWSPATDHWRGESGAPYCCS